MSSSLNFILPLETSILSYKPSILKIKNSNNNHFNHNPKKNLSKNPTKKKQFKTQLPNNKRKMDFRMMGFDAPFLNTIHDLLDSDEYEFTTAQSQPQKPTSGAQSYVRDARAMARTAADVKDTPNAYQFIIDMPGLKSGDIKVQVEGDNVLVISGVRKREQENKKEGVKYLRMERRVGKFMRKFPLPEDANLEGINAVCQDGVLTVTVEKLPPPEPKKPKTIEVQVA